MEMLASHEFWVGLATIIWVNLLLSGDNAVVIALASRSLPPAQQKKAIFWGSGAAIALRIVLTVFAVQLLQWPYLKLIGGILLIYIGVQLLMPEDDGDNIASHDNLYQAIKTILIADLVMSLDNVIAVAAAAESAPGDAKVVLLILGLAISIPIVIFGSKLVLHFMERYPIIITLGAALLGWLAGEMMVSDPAVNGWVDANVPWLKTLYVAKIAGALLVMAIGKMMAGKKQAEHGSTADEPAPLKSTRS